MAPTHPSDADPISFVNATRSRGHFDVPSHFQDKADYIDFLYGPQQSALANFVYSPKIKYAWMILIFSCILDRVFPRSASPLPKRLSKRLSHVKLFVVCAYPLAAAGHILSYLKDITEDLFVPQIPEPFMDSLIVVRLFNVLGGILTASWMFGLVNSRGALPFPVFLFASIALPFTIWGTFTIQLSSEGTTYNPVLEEMVSTALDALPLLYSLYRYVRNGLFDRPRYHLLIFLALFTSWLCTLALSWLLEFRFWDTLLRHAIGMGPRPTCACRPFPSLPSSMMLLGVSKHKVAPVALTSMSFSQDEASRERYSLEFDVPATVIFSRHVWEPNSFGDTWLVYTLCNVDLTVFSSLANAWGFVAFHASLIVLSVMLLSAAANWIGWRWLTAAYKLVQHKAMDNIWAMIASCAATVWIIGGANEMVVCYMVVDWVTRVVIVFYRINKYLPPQYTRFREAQVLQLGLEWLSKATFIVSLVEAGCRTRSWVLSVLGNWRGKKTNTMGQEKDSSLPVESDYEKGSTK